MWPGFPCYAEACREVLGLRLPVYDTYQPWEDATVHGGLRVLHEEFCIVSDFPKTLKIDTDNRAHCDDGPSHEWRDGWRLWYIHGVTVDEQIVMRPETQTIDQIEKEENTEVRRVRIERYGWERYLTESKAEVLDTRRNDRDAQTEKLYRLKTGGTRFVCTDPSTGRRYSLGVPVDVTTCEQAQHWMSHGLDTYATHRS